MVIHVFGMLVDDDLLCRRIENQPSPAYSSLCLSNFRSLHTSKNESAIMIIFGTQDGDDLLYRGFGIQPSFAYSNFLSFYTSKNDFFFIKDFSATMQARMIISGIQANDDLLYGGIGMYNSPAYSSNCLSIFLSFHTSKYKIFRQRFFHSHASLRGHIWFHGDLLYRWIENQSSPASLYLSGFLSLLTWNNAIFVTDSTTTLQGKMFIFDIQIDNSLLHSGIANQPCPAHSSCICLIFFLSILRIMKFFIKDILAIVFKPE